MSSLLDVTGVGNAIVDIIAHAGDADIERLGIIKGAMQLIDEARGHSLYAQLAPAVEMSGGSVANSMAGIASLGGITGYIGKVRNDQLGDIFQHDIRAAGIAFSTRAADQGPSTARCFILVTPDGQRTMNTYLGACVDLGPEDIDEALIERSKVVYLEGYLWDPPRAKEAMLRAANVAHAAGRKVALSASDAFCIQRHHAEFKRLIDDHIDILFANEAELLALTEQSDFDAAVDAIKGHCEVAVCTRGERGALVVADKLYHVAAHPVPHVVDTTGAGDLFAAGFLYGYTQGRPHDESARIGAICAAEIIGHYGARPAVKSLRALIESHGL
jgi:sugar/nucleoside kinase (ribokinase family)